MSPQTTDASNWIRRIRLRHLEILLAISQHESLTAAANALDMTQPAASQWLADIEAAIGVPLFTRGRRLQPTIYAAPLLRHAERVLGDSRRVVDEVAAVRGGDFGLVRIGVMLVGATVLVPQAICKLRSSASPIRIEVIEDVTSGLWARFERNELDLIIGRLDDRALSSGYPQEVLFSDTYCVVSGPQHVLAKKAAVSWQDAARYPWIMPSPGTPLRSAIESTFIRDKVTLPEVWLDSASFTANQALFRSTDCLGVLSSNVAKYYQSLNLLTQLPLFLPETLDVGDVGMIWKENEPGIALITMLDALRSAGTHLAEAA